MCFGIQDRFCGGESQAQIGIISHHDEKPAADSGSVKDLLGVGRDGPHLQRRTRQGQQNPTQGLVHTPQGEVRVSHVGPFSIDGLIAEMIPADESALYSTSSRPCDTPETGKIAVEVINHYGDEVLKVFDV